MSNLANAHGALGQYRDAQEVFLEVLALQKVRLGPDHIDTLRTMSNLAINYGALGQHEDALNLHEEALALRKVKLGSNHPDALESMWGMAGCLIRLHRGAEAVAIIDECFEHAAGKSVRPTC